MGKIRIKRIFLRVHNTHLEMAIQPSQVWRFSQTPEPGHSRRRDTDALAPSPSFWGHLASWQLLPHQTQSKAVARQAWQDVCRLHHSARLLLGRCCWEEEGSHISKLFFFTSAEKVSQDSFFLFQTHLTPVRLDMHSTSSCR